MFHSALRDHLSVNAGKRRSNDQTHLDTTPHVQSIDAPLRNL
jgi:hypothetical protein